MTPVLRILIFSWIGTAVATASAPEIISVGKIWDRAPHSAFTDLVRYQGKWFCTFREGERHAGGRNGRLRVLVSEDGDGWKSAALVTEEGVDLRDPKLSVMADGRLLLISGGSLYDGDRYLTRAPRVAFSGNGFDWTPPRRVLAEDHWIWRVTWHKGRGYGVSKLGETPTPRRAFLYWTTDGIEWNWITEFKLPGLTPEARKTAPSETTVRFLPDDRMVALIRPGWVGSSFAALPGMDFSQAGTPSGRTQFHPDTRRLFVGRVPRVSARNARDRTLDPGRTLHHPGPIDLDRLRTGAQATQRRRHELPGDGLAPGASLDQLLLFP